MGVTAGLWFLLPVPSHVSWTRPNEEAGKLLGGNERLALLFKASGFYLFKKESRSGALDGLAAAHSCVCKSRCLSLCGQGF